MTGELEGAIPIDQSILAFDVTTDAKELCISFANHQPLVVQANPAQIVSRIGRRLEFCGPSITYSEDVRSIFTVSNNGRKVSRWNRTTGELISEFQPTNSSIHSVVFNSKSGRFFAGADGGLVISWPIDASMNSRVLSGHQLNVHDVALSTDGQVAISGSSDQTARLWKLNSMSLQNVFGRMTLRRNAETGLPETLEVERGSEGHQGPIVSVAIAPNKARVATGSTDRTIRIWNATNGELEKIIDSGGEALSLRFSPDGTKLAAGTWGDAVHIWDTSDWKHVLALHGHTSNVESIAIDSTGQILASGSTDGTVRVWDLKTGEVLRDFREHIAPVTSVDIDCHGRIASGGPLNQVKIWTIDPAQPTLSIVTGSHRSIAFHPNGNRLAVGGDNVDRLGITIYNVEPGREEALRTLNIRGRFGGISSLAFDDSGSKLVASSHDGNVYVWGANLDRNQWSAGAPLVSSIPQNKLDWATARESGKHVGRSIRTHGHFRVDEYRDVDNVKIELEHADETYLAVSVSIPHQLLALTPEAYGKLALDKPTTVPRESIQSIARGLFRLASGEELIRAEHVASFNSFSGFFEIMSSQSSERLFHSGRSAYWVMFRVPASVDASSLKLRFKDHDPISLGDRELDASELQLNVE